MLHNHHRYQISLLDTSYYLSSSTKSVMSYRDIIAIAYSEFDKIIGPQLKIWYPPDSLQPETFDSFSQYVILDKEYCNRVVRVAMEDYHLLSWSSTVENPKYFRNSITFSFSLVLQHYADVEIYGRALKKIASTFVAMEVEHEFLTRNQELKVEMTSIFQRLFHDLTKSSKAIFCHTSTSPLPSKSYFNILLYHLPEITNMTVEDYHVPVIVHNYIDLTKLPCEISLQHLLMHIDGISHVRKLAREVVMDIECVKRALLILVHHKVVILSDIFKFTNIYQLVDEEAWDILARPDVEHEMVAFSLYPSLLPYFLYPKNNELISNEDVSIMSSRGSETELIRSSAPSPIPMTTTTTATTTNTTNTVVSSTTPSTTTERLSSSSSSAKHGIVLPTSGGQLPSYRLLCTALISLIADLHPGHRLCHIVLQHRNKFLDNLFKIVDLVRLLAFLQHKEIITRVHEYPVYLGPDPMSQSMSQMSIGGNQQDNTITTTTDGTTAGSAPASSPSPATAGYYGTEHKFVKLSKKVSNKSIMSTGPSGSMTSIPSQHHMTTHDSLNLEAKKDWLNELVRLFDGRECLDYLCSKFEINHLDVLNHPHVHIVYK